METSTARAIHDPAAEFYIDALRKLQATNIPFLVGGAFAFSHYSHVPRETKDIDVFVKPADCRRVLEAFEELGYRTALPFPHWLGKIHRGDYFMDVIFNSGNGVARVDDLWFDHAPKTNVLGLIVRLSPVEEMIWSKAFIQERERFDGADVMHLLHETGRPSTGRGSSCASAIIGACCSATSSCSDSCIPTSDRTRRHG